MPAGADALRPIDEAVRLSTCRAQPDSFADFARLSSGTISMLLNEISGVIGAKSLTGSNFRSGIERGIDGMAAGVPHHQQCSRLARRVLDRHRRDVAAPPGRFSMTIGCLRLSDTRFETSRITTSELPPATNGTSSVIGRDGKSACACAGAAPTARATATTARYAERVLIPRNDCPFFKISAVPSMSFSSWRSNIRSWNGTLVPLALRLA